MNPLLLKMMGKRKRRNAGLMSLLSGGSGLMGGLGGLGGANMNQLLVSKMMSDDDEFDCYAPLDRDIADNDQVRKIVTEI